MSSSADRCSTTVLQGAAALHARPAQISADLRTTPYASRGAIDPRLVDPTLVAVVAEAEERARAAGFERGRREGVEVGRREAALAAEAQLRQAEAAEARRGQEWSRTLDAVRQALADLDARDAPVHEDVERTVASMAVEIAEVLVGRHLQLADLPALDAVHRAFALAPRQSAAVVRLHPADLARLPEGSHELADGLPGGSVTVVADPSVERHGCIVEAGDRSIDAQLGPALERLREVIA